MTRQVQTDANKSSYQGTQEEILVVRRDDLFANIGSWHGLNTTILDTIIPIITEKQEFKMRNAMETDHRYKQIIPYLVFCHNQQLFVMQRKSDSSDQRLASKLSVGIGGHMRKEDMSSNSLFDWSRREFLEEVSYEGSYRITKLGIINDDTNEVGKVHLGIVLLLHGSSNAIAIQDEHKHGCMMTLTECMEKRNRFESWSTIILDHIATHTTLLG